MPYLATHLSQWRWKTDFVIFQKKVSCLYASQYFLRARALCHLENVNSFFYVKNNYPPQMTNCRSTKLGMLIGQTARLHFISLIYTSIQIIKLDRLVCHPFYVWYTISGS